MINLKKVKQYYKEYISNYNPEDPKIALKIAHIYRTAKKAKDIAVNLGLSEEDVVLVELIGMLHDIGRFEQIRLYNTFIDSKSVNHAEYGVKVLFEDGLIEKFVEDRQYDDIIYKAVINHNRDKIENGLDERTLMHCKIIRDADKWDILYLLTFENPDTIYNILNYTFDNEITPIIYQQYVSGSHIDYSKRRVSEDLLVSHIAFIFDVYFNYTLKQIDKEKYIKTIINRYKYENEKLKKQIDEVYKKASKYIENRLLEE